MKTLRCAIYTRKSSEEGLEQDFNSLHAQREACEAYVLSQAGEGWTALKSAYDDGGISGGTMERPGLEALLADIVAGKIDVVIVYKVDRLTRSLTDFAKIVEIFDRHQASFVSVTQAFNTTSSMGRLTLNVLLSFAQFEREVTGERIRDKIAASKKKGLWMGGNLPLGYDADGRTLKVAEHEAIHVRHIFTRYLELRSAHRLVEELAAAGIRSKRRTTKDGREIGGAAFSRGALFHLLANRVYVGEIAHKDQTYPGLHSAIVDRALFDSVQEVLAENRRRHASPSVHQLGFALTGKVFDADGIAMSPTTARGKYGGRYRYYVSTTLQTGRRAKDDQVLRRIRASSLEDWVAQTLSRVFSSTPVPLDHLARLEIYDQHAVMALAMELLLAPGENHDQFQGIVRGRLHDGERAWLDKNCIYLSLPVRLAFQGGRRWIEGGEMRPRRVPNPTFIKALRRAHTDARALAIPTQEMPGPTPSLRSSDSYRRRMVTLAYLAPRVQKAIMDGDLAASLSLEDLLKAAEMPAWSLQQQALSL